jgi:tetratricopeptide (TPR) repeat protein
MRMVAWAAAALVTFGVSVQAQWAHMALPPPDLDVNMLFVPPPEMTKALATGYENLVADGLWLGLLQYYGDRLVQEDMQRRRAVNLAPMFNLITDLDPRFWFAYWLGAWALGDNKEADAAIALLQKGEKANPTDYNYAYLQGFIQFLERKDYPAAYQAFDRATKFPDAPRFAKTMAARMLQKEGLDQQALQIWMGIYETAQDKVTKDIAKRNVERIQQEMKGEAPRAYKVGKPKPGEAK